MSLSERHRKYVIINPMDDFEELIEDGDGEVTVTSPAGYPVPVLNQEEADYYNDVAKRYTIDNRFENVTDLQDLDRVLLYELVCYRWGLWISTGREYDGSVADEELIKKSLNDYSKELRLLKKHMGLDKMSRDKEKGESVQKYIDNLLIRAKQFGVMRNEQAIKGITLFKELESLIIYHNNCTDDERKQNHITKDEIWDWIENVAIPEHRSIDEKFRETNQKYWIRDQ